MMMKTKQRLVLWKIDLFSLAHNYFEEMLLEVFEVGLDISSRICAKCD